MKLRDDVQASIMSVFGRALPFWCYLVFTFLSFVCS